MTFHEKPRVSLKGQSERAFAICKPRTIPDPDMMNTEDALTRAGLGFILGRISHLKTVHPKSQVELDELATLETIRDRYYCKMVIRLAASCFPFLAL